MADQTDATHLEPLAKGELDRQHAALISIAVSLKRIADALDGIIRATEFHAPDPYPEEPAR